MEKSSWKVDILDIHSEHLTEYTIWTVNGDNKMFCLFKNLYIDFIFGVR